MMRINGAGALPLHSGYKKAIEPAILSLQPSSVFLGVGDVAQLSPVAPRSMEGSSFLWKSTNPNVVSVDQQGRAVAHATGLALISCEAVLGDAAAKGSVNVVVS